MIMIAFNIKFEQTLSRSVIFIIYYSEDNMFNKVIKNWVNNTCVAISLYAMNTIFRKIKT